MFSLYRFIFQKGNIYRGKVTAIWKMITFVLYLSIWTEHKAHARRKEGLRPTKHTPGRTCHLTTTTSAIPTSLCSILLFSQSSGTVPSLYYLIWCMDKGQESLFTTMLSFLQCTHQLDKQLENIDMQTYLQKPNHLIAKYSTYAPLLPLM